jgi:hypothetical protein
MGGGVGGLTRRTSLRATARCNTGTACTLLPRGNRRTMGEDIPRREKQHAGTDSYGRYEVISCLDSFCRNSNASDTPVPRLQRQRAAPGRMELNGAPSFG